MSQSNEESKKRFLDLLSEFSEHQEKIDLNYIEDANSFWNSLSKEDQMFAFYVVTKTIADSELKDDFDSYRKILYEQFEFPAESYYIGMLSRFIELHNHILRPSEQKDYSKYCRDRIENAQKNRIDN
jgi:uncharacterized protein YozE (UPF0346 family)